MANQPRVWILLGPKNGDNAQLRALARLLTWPCEEKQLVFNRLAALPNIFLAQSLISTKNGKTILQPPWPDLVVTIGRRAVPAARWVQKRSGMHSKLVHLGRPWGPLRWFDLVVTTPQYGLPERSNVLHNILPISWQDPQLLEETAAVWSARFRSLPRPWIALLCGGTSRPYILDNQCATALGQAASAFAGKQHGSLLVTASTRCPPASFAALTTAITSSGCPAHIHNPHAANQDNPYLAYLALADIFIVTCDSASMLAEASQRQKPVFVYPLPVYYDVRMRWARWLRSCALGDHNGAARLWSRLYNLLTGYGLLNSTRDEQLFVAALQKKELVAPFGQEWGETPATVPHQEERQRTLSRIQALFAPNTTGPADTHSAS